VPGKDAHKLFSRVFRILHLGIEAAPMATSLDALRNHHIGAVRLDGLCLLKAGGAYANAYSERLRFADQRCGGQSEVEAQHPGAMHPHGFELGCEIGRVRGLRKCQACFPGLPRKLRHRQRQRGKRCLALRLSRRTPGRKDEEIGIDCAGVEGCIGAWNSTPLTLGAKRFAGRRGEDSLQIMRNPLGTCVGKAKAPKAACAQHGANQGYAARAAGHRGLDERKAQALEKFPEAAVRVRTARCVHVYPSAVPCMCISSLPVQSSSASPV